jgi:hypothetical protein
MLKSLNVLVVVCLECGGNRWVNICDIEYIQGPRADSGFPDFGGAITSLRGTEIMSP